jgi:hypothetical protein
LVRSFVIVLFPDGNWKERPAVLVALLPMRYENRGTAAGVPSALDWGNQ